MIHGKSIRLFLVDGTPGGIVTAEIMNWTGLVTTAPRSRLSDILRRPETGRTGIYLLTGDDPENLGRSLVYIGESDNVGKRITQHAFDEEAGGKDFWDKMVLITSKDTHFTKSHARYIESRLIEVAKRVDRAGCTNKTTPPACTLPEADIADMEYFIEQIRVVLPVLGTDMLRDRKSLNVSTDVQGERLPVTNQLFEINRQGLQAKAQEIDGEFIVLAGSLAKNEWPGSDHGYKSLRQSLITEKRLQQATQSGYLVFVEDTAFRSPSAASAVILGRPDNGRKSWLVAGTNQSYAEWQAALVPAIPNQD